MYTLECKSYDGKYVGKTKRLLKTRVREHRDEVEKIRDSMPLTRRTEKPQKQRQKSAITEDRVMDENSARIVVKNSDWRARGIKESIVIRKNLQNINREEDRTFLSHLYLYDDLLPELHLT